MKEKTIYKKQPRKLDKIIATLVVLSLIVGSIYGIYKAGVWLMGGNDTVKLYVITYDNEDVNKARILGTELKYDVVKEIAEDAEETAGGDLVYWDDMIYVIPGYGWTSKEDFINETGTQNIKFEELTESQFLTIIDRDGLDYFY